MSDDICPCCEAKRAAELVARGWERQSKQWEGAAKLLRKKLDRATAIAVVLSVQLADAHEATESAQALAGQLERLVNEQRAVIDELESDNAHLRAAIALLEHRLGEAHQGLTVAEGG